MPFVSSLRGTFGPTSENRGVAIPTAQGESNRIDPPIYSFTNATFTPGAANGTTGPTLAQAIAGMSGTGVSAWNNNTTYFNVSGGIQLWTVPYTGAYRIEAYGAGGGLGDAGGGANRGSGARMRGDFNLVKNQQIKILVGQQGGSAAQTGNPAGGGGGGGTFVTTSANSPLIVAGGGNGDSWYSFSVDAPSALTTNNGTTNGGAASGRGGGGGGLIGNGATNNGGGGLSFTNGGTGGAASGQGGVGGFGGGGGSLYEGGGGGGYNGGSVVNTNDYGTDYRSTYYAGSYNIGTNQSNTAATNGGNGSVIITAL